MLVLIFSLGLLSAMHLPDAVSEALIVPDLCRSIFQHIDFSDMINCRYVSKTFNMASSTAILSFYGDYKDPQEFDWLKAFTFVAEREDEEKKKNVLRFLNIIWPEADTFTYRRSYLRYSFLLLAQFSLGKLTHMSDGFGGPPEILRVPILTDEMEPVQQDFSLNSLYSEIRQIECPADCSSIQRALYLLGIIKSQGLSAQYFLNSKTISEEDYQNMTLAAYDELTAIGSTLMIGRSRPKPTGIEESKSFRDFETQWRKFDSDPKFNGLEWFFVKVMDDAPDHFQTGTQEQFIFYMLSKSAEDFINVMKWPSWNFWGCAFSGRVDLFREFYEPVPRKFVCIIF